MESNYIKAIYRARAIFASYDSEAIRTQYKLAADEEYLYLNYLSQPYRICRKDGRVDEGISGEEGHWQESCNFESVFTIYDLLTVSLGKPVPPFTDRWQKIEGFVVVTTPSANTFTKKYEALFTGQTERLQKACEMLGASILSPYAGADLSVEFSVLPFFQVRMQFWDADDEFPAQIVLLWNTSALSYLRYETSFYLQGDILKRISTAFEAL